MRINHCISKSIETFTEAEARNTYDTTNTCMDKFHYLKSYGLRLSSALEESGVSIEDSEVSSESINKIMTLLTEHTCK